MNALSLTDDCNRQGKQRIPLMLPIPFLLYTLDTFTDAMLYFLFRVKRNYRAVKEARSEPYTVLVLCSKNFH